MKSLNHDDVATKLVSPDATPASTWNRGSAFRLLAHAGWNGSPEVEDLLEAARYLQVEIDRVKARDYMLSHPITPEEQEEADHYVSATLSATPLAPWPSTHNQVPFYPPGVRNAGQLYTDGETHLPSCEGCNTELVQDATQGYKPVCPNHECPESPYYEGALKMPMVVSAPVQKAPEPINGRITSHYAPVPMQRPQTAFERYQQGVVPASVIPGDRTQVLRMPELTDDTRSMQESLEQGADEEPTK